MPTEKGAKGRPSPPVGRSPAAGAPAPPPEVDIFRDLLRPFYDWQSSRTRRGLNGIIAAEAALHGVMPPLDPMLYSESPRLVPIPNGSALCHVATGQFAGPMPPAYPLTPRNGPGAPEFPNPYAGFHTSDRKDTPRNELFALWPNQTNDTGFADDPMGSLNMLGFLWRKNPRDSGNHTFPAGPVSSFMSHLSYDETLLVLAYLSTVLDEPILPGVEGSRTFREFLDAMRAPANGGGAPALTLPDDVWRLYAFTQPLPSLRRQPGRVLLRWYHPYELTNEFVGWNFMGEHHAIAAGNPDDPEQASRLMPEAFLWPTPSFKARLADNTAAQEPTVAGWVLTRSVSLYSGQHIVGDGDSSTNSHRMPGDYSTLATGFRQFQDQSGDLLGSARKDYSERRLTGLIWLPTQDDATAPRRMSALSLAERRDPAFAVPAALPSEACLFRAAPDAGGPVRDVSIRDLGIFIEFGAVQTPTGALPALDSVLNLDGIHRCRIERVRIEGSVRKQVDLASVRARDDAPPVPPVQAMVDHAPLRLGVDAPTSEVLFRDVWVRLLGHHALLHFGPQASDCVFWGGELAGGASVEGESPAAGVIHWSPGSVANTVLRGSSEVTMDRSPAHYLMEGTAGVVASMRFESQGYPSDDDPRMPADYEIWIRPAGVGNVVDHQYLHFGTVRDEGRRSFVRAWRNATAAVAPAPIRALTHENLLSDETFADLLAGRRHAGPSWVGQGQLLSTADGGGIVLDARGGVPALVMQIVPIWSQPSPSPPHPVANGLPLPQTRAVGLARRGQVSPMMRESERDLVAAVRLGMPAGARVKFALLAGGRTEIRELSGGPAGVDGEVCIHSRNLDAASVVFLVEALAGRVVVRDPALVEGTRLPTYPVAPLSTSGGRIYGELWLPGPTAALDVEPNESVVVSQSVEIVSVFSSSGVTALSDDLPFVLLRQNASGDEEVLCHGRHRANQCHHGTPISGRPMVLPGERLELRLAEKSALSQSQRRASRFQLQLNTALLPV